MQKKKIKIYNNWSITAKNSPTLKTCLKVKQILNHYICNNVKSRRKTKIFIDSETKLKCFKSCKSLENRGNLLVCLDLHAKPILQNDSNKIH